MVGSTTMCHLRIIYDVAYSDTASDHLGPGQPRLRLIEPPQLLLAAQVNDDLLDPVEVHRHMYERHIGRRVDCQLLVLCVLAQTPIPAREDSHVPSPTSAADQDSPTPAHSPAVTCCLPLAAREA